MNQLDHDQEHLASLTTERAFLEENGKTARMADVDDEIEAVQARITVARQAAGLETADVAPAPETTDSPPVEPAPKGRGRQASKPKDDSGGS